MKKSPLLLCAFVGLCLLLSKNVSAMTGEGRQDSEETKKGTSIDPHKGTRENTQRYQEEAIWKEYSTVGNLLFDSETGRPYSETGFLQESDQSDQEEKKTEGEEKTPLLSQRAMESLPKKEEVKPGDSTFRKLKGFLPSTFAFWENAEKDSQLEKDLQKIRDIEKKIKDLENQKTFGESSPSNKILELLKKEVYGTYQKVYFAQKNKKPEIAFLERKKGEALEGQVETLLETKEGIPRSNAAYQEKRANAWKETSLSWQKAIDNYERYPEVHFLYHASALAFKDMVSALEQKMPKVATLHNERGYTLREAAESHKEASKVEAGDKTPIFLQKKAVLMKKEKALTKEIKTLSLDPTKKESKEEAWYWKKKVELLGGNQENHGAVQAYREALRAKDPLERDYRLKSASHFEKAESVLPLAELENAPNYYASSVAADHHEGIAHRWGGTERYPGVASLYAKRNEALVSGKKEEAYYYQEASDSMKDSTEALSENKLEEARLARERVEIWMKLLQHHHKTSSTRPFKKNKRQREINHKIEEILKSQIEVLKAQKDFLEDETAVALCEKSYAILRKIEEEYHVLIGIPSELEFQDLEEEEDGYTTSRKLKLQDLEEEEDILIETPRELKFRNLEEERLLALRKQASFLVKEARSIMESNWQEAEFYSALAEAWGEDEKKPGVAAASRWVAYVREKNYKIIADKCEESLLEFKKYAEHLAQGDMTKEELLLVKGRAMILGDYSNEKSRYRKAYLDDIRGNDEGANAWHESIVSDELSVEAKNDGNRQEAYYFNFLTGLWGEIAYYHDQAFQAREEGRSEDAEKHEQEAKEKHKEIRRVWKEI